MYKIVNLETFFIPEEQKYDVLIKEIGDCDKVLGLMLADGFIHETPGNVIRLLAEQVDLTIVAGLAAENTDYKKVIPFNFNLHTTYNSYKDKETHCWNTNAQKFLFLGGVPNRPNRIGLLDRYRKSNLLKHAEWTFFKPWTQEQEVWCRNQVSDYDEILKLCRQIDNIYETSKHYGTEPSDNQWTKDTAWLDPSIFQNTLLSVVSEGISDSDLSYKYLTEKTYRVFVQRHPFLHASNPEMFNHIKDLGFKTFEDYMLIKDYAYLPSEEDRLDAIVSNTKYFLENYKTNIKNIQKDVDYNYDHFFNLVENNLTTLKELSKNFGIEQLEIDKWFNQKGFHHLIRYNIIDKRK